MTKKAFTYGAAVCPALLNAILDMCSGSIAIIQNGQILCANQAFSETSGFLAGAQLRGCLLKDVIPEPLDPALSTFKFLRGGAMITVSTSYFTQDTQTLQVMRLSRGPQPPRAWPPQGSKTVAPATEAWVRFAHGFNNLLTRVMLSSDLLLSEIESGSELLRHVEAIQNAGIDGAEMIKQMTCQSSHRHLVTVFSWNQVASEMMGTLISCVGPGVHVRSKLTDLMGLGKVSAGRAYRIILSLVLTAQRDMGGGGTITLSIRNSCKCSGFVTNGTPSVSHVEFVVTHTADRVAKRTMDPLFDGQSRTRSGTRPLLGLKMIRNIVKSAGGEFEVDTHVGQGIRQTIRMPLADNRGLSKELNRIDNHFLLESRSR